MKLPYDEDKSDGISPFILTTLCISALFLLILIVVYVLNRPKSSSDGGNSVPVMQSEIEVSEEYIRTEEHTLTPDDFDFWDLYPEKTPEVHVVESSEEEKSVPIDDPATDGKHTLIKKANGEEEWILINSFLTQNDYDSTCFVKKSGKMQYYQEGRPTSFWGVDLSKTQEYVDFTKLKKAGVDFVMLRVGVRGYESGVVVLDECFQDNIKRASDAGLQIGLYFSSQAVSQEEIAEEAQFVLDHIQEYNVTYPIAFDMEYVSNDSCRVEKISKKTKTELAIAFCDIMRLSGYYPMIYGNKEWLLKEIDLSKLNDYDIWLSQVSDLPDYPYRFAMWQYDRAGEIDGVVGTVNFNISFIDYSEK